MTEVKQMKKQSRQGIHRALSQLVAILLLILTPQAYASSPSPVQQQELQAIAVHKLGIMEQINGAVVNDAVLLPSGDFFLGGVTFKKDGSNENWLLQMNQAGEILSREVIDGLQSDSPRLMNIAFQGDTRMLGIFDFGYSYHYLLTSINDNTYEQHLLPITGISDIDLSGRGMMLCGILAIEEGRTHAPWAGFMNSHGQIEWSYQGETQINSEKLEVFRQCIAIDDGYVLSKELSDSIGQEETKYRIMKILPGNKIEWEIESFWRENESLGISRSTTDLFWANANLLRAGTFNTPEKRDGFLECLDVKNGSTLWETTFYEMPRVFAFLPLEDGYLVAGRMGGPEKTLYDWFFYRLDLGGNIVGKGHYQWEEGNNLHFTSMVTVDGKNVWIFGESYEDILAIELPIP